MKRILILFSAIILCGACTTQVNVPDADEGQICHVEPPSWFIDMKCPLQLMVNGPGIAAYDVAFAGGHGVSVKEVHKAESENYLFVDISISGRASAGTYYLIFSKDGESFRYPYVLENRRKGSAARKSFTTADMIYLIMPDRFANGDPSNDSVNGLADSLHREQASGRHGGDIQGMIDHLDYIEDLGATAIWCTPLLLDNDKRGSYHGYAAADYYKIDPRFGDNELYRKFVSNAHEHNLKVIMDVVTNHSGTTTHWWSDDLPFYDWIHHFDEYTGSNYAFSSLSDPYAADNDRYIMDSGWFTKGMADMNLDNPYLLKYFQQWAIWWIEWADLDGFRVDTYPYNEKYPMAQWCKAVTDEYPDFNIVGECWIGSPASIAYWQKDNPNTDGFNSYLPSVMDFPLMNAANRAFSPQEASMKGIYDVLAMDFLYHDTKNILVFPSNHDTRRVGDVVGKNPERLKLMMTLFATVRGIPQIFSGDEMMFSASDLKEGDGGKRVDFPGGWTGDKFDLFTKEGRLAANLDFDGEPITKGTREDLYEYCSKLFNWRKAADVIHNGKTLHFIPQKNSYGYFRYDDETVVFVFLNNSSSKSAKIPWSSYSQVTSGLTSGRNVITGESITITDDTELGPLQSLIVEFKNK